MGHDEILVYLQSLDSRLGTMDKKFDGLINGDVKLAGVVTDEKCSKCQTNWIDKKYLTGFGIKLTCANIFAVLALLLGASADTVMATIDKILGGK